VEYSSPDEVAVCNLASISLPEYIDLKKPDRYDYEKLARVVAKITRWLNKVIDKNSYPITEAEYSNKKHRPIGIGVQGLANVFYSLELAWEDEEARLLNRKIFETIYYAALKESHSLGITDGVYSTFKGSQYSKGIFQYDHWKNELGIPYEPILWKKEFQELKELIKKDGLRNSLLVAPMPTASTSQILGNNESFEPGFSNMFLRRTLCGEFMVINPYLYKILKAQGLATDSVKEEIARKKGSVQGIESIPKRLQDIFKTVWEIENKTLVHMAMDRGAFIDQSQSFNIFLKDAKIETAASYLYYIYKNGMKGWYYTRSKQESGALQVDMMNVGVSKKKVTEDPVVVANEDQSSSLKRRKSTEEENSEEGVESLRKKQQVEEIEPPKNAQVFDSQDLLQLMKETEESYVKMDCPSCSG
jgi:ribonucleotide reductase alpha subunit